VEPGGERCHPKKESSLQGLVSEQSRDFLFAVCWGVKGHSLSDKKCPKCSHRRFSDTNWIALNGQPRKFSGKPSAVSARIARSIVKTVFCSAMNSKGGHPWRMERVFQRFSECTYFYTMKNTRGAFGGGICHRCEVALPVKSLKSEKIADYDEI